MEHNVKVRLTDILLVSLGRLSLWLLLLCALLALAHSLNGQEGVIRACFYHDKYVGRPTASGALYDPAKLTAAHLTLPLGTVLQVRNVHTGQTVRVVVNDRGPYSSKYGLDLSLAAARALGITKQAGWGTVRYTVVELGDNRHRRYGVSCRYDNSCGKGVVHGK